MTPISIQTSGSRLSASPWAQYALTENPFPPSGVPTDVDYDAHQPDVVAAVNRWLGNSVAKGASQWRPMAISGSIGVGKTHVLRKMERACVAYREEENLGPKLLVSSHALTGTGMKTLLLSDMLHEALSQRIPSRFGDESRSEIPLLDLCIDELRDRHSSDARVILDSLPKPSPLTRPLHAVAHAADDGEAQELGRLLSAWLSRRPLTRKQTEQIGVGRRLEPEGQAVRALAHVCHLALKTLDFRVCVLLIDQIEDLWRRDLTTPLRRARFLTDLRSLIDEALEGSPIAVTLAWNTEIQVGQRYVEEDVSDRLSHDYLALFSRIDEVVQVPTLPREHAMPFAHAYVDHEHKKFEQKHGQRGAVLQAKKEDFAKMLDNSEEEIFSLVDAYGTRPDGSLIARAWLDALRKWADSQVGD